MKSSKVFLSLIMLVTLNLGVCYAFNFGGSFNYQTSSGGIIHFSRDISAVSFGQRGSLTMFSDVVWNGKGFLAIDASMGTTVTFTSLQRRCLVYFVEDVGSSMQIINYRDYGEPTDVSGGTYIMSGDDVIIITSGNVVVTISWITSTIQQVNSIFMALGGVCSIIPLWNAAVAIQGAANGSMNPSEFNSRILSSAFALVILYVLGIVIKTLMLI